MRSVMACDAVYYQLYYGSLVQNDSGSALYLRSSRTPSRTLANGARATGPWNESWSSKLIGPEHASALRAHFGLLCCSKEERRIATRIITHSPHSTGCVGTKPGRCFAVGSRRRPTTTRRTPCTHHRITASTSTLEERHTTLAPPLLQEWRDSCRDFVCHLYGYATVSSRTLHSLRTTSLTDIQTVVEVGAGTGYLAHLLQRQGDWDVVAYDVAPASRRNEYHAATPLFTTVHSGTATNFGTKLLRQSNPTNHTARSPAALLSTTQRSHGVASACATMFNTANNSNKQ